MILLDLIAFGIFIVLACACFPLFLILKNGLVISGIRALVWGIFITSITTSIFDIVSMLGLVPLVVYSSGRKIVGRLPILVGMLVCIYQFYWSRKSDEE